MRINLLDESSEISEVSTSSRKTFNKKSPTTSHVKQDSEKVDGEGYVSKAIYISCTDLYLHLDNHHGPNSGVWWPSYQTSWFRGGDLL